MQIYFKRRLQNVRISANLILIFFVERAAYRGTKDNQMLADEPTIAKLRTQYANTSFADGELKVGTKKQNRIKNKFRHHLQWL